MASTSTAHRTSSLWAAGLSTFAATLMIVVGLFQFVEGLVAVINGTDFLVRTASNVFARSVGIALAGVSAIANFMWLPHYPIWAIIIIALDVFVIWALCTVNLGEV